jgi:hypothetical protein
MAEPSPVHPHQGIWLWTAGAWLLIGGAVVSGYLVRTKRFDVVSPPMLGVFACGVLAVICVMGAVRGWQFPFTKRAVDSLSQAGITAEPIAPAPGQNPPRYVSNVFADEPGLLESSGAKPYEPPTPDLLTIPTPHLEQIKRICRVLASSVGSGTEPEYDDPESALSNDPRTRRAIEVHCPNVASACTQWDEALTQIDQAVGSLENKIKTEVQAHFASPWLPDWIVPITLERTKGWARTPGWEIPRLRITHHQWQPGQMATDEGDYAYCGSYMVLYKKGLTDDEARVAENELNRFVESAVQWQEAQLLQTAFARQVVRLGPAQVAALEILDRHSLPRNGGCPLC